MSSNPNVVLVHGAWADGSSWSKVISLLQAKGFIVSAAQIALTSLADDIATTQRLISMQKGPIVLVGHCYGGAVITGAAKDCADVEALVYIAALGPEEGESLSELSKEGPGLFGASHVKRDSSGFLWIDRAGFRQVFAADVDAREADVMAAVQKPLSLASFAEKSGTPSWRTIPSWYLISSNDRMIPPPAQEFMAKRMNATQRSVPASHASMVSHPKEVAEIITLAAESIYV